MICGPHPLGVGAELRGKSGNRYWVLECLDTSGKNGRLYLVSLSPPQGFGEPHTAYSSLNERTNIAKFFGVRGVREHVGDGLGPSTHRAFKRYKKEPRFLRLFNDPHIVKYVDESTNLENSRASSDDSFYVMEHLRGGSLDQHIDDNSLPAEEIQDRPRHCPGPRGRTQRRSHPS